MDLQQERGQAELFIAHLEALDKEQRCTRRLQSVDENIITWLLSSEVPDTVSNHQSPASEPDTARDSEIDDYDATTQVLPKIGPSYGTRTSPRTFKRTHIGHPQSSRKGTSSSSKFNVEFHDLPRTSDHYVVSNANGLWCNCGTLFTARRVKNIRSNWKRHVSSRSELLPCGVESCDKQFNRPDNRKQHIRICHPTHYQSLYAEEAQLYPPSLVMRRCSRRKLPGVQHKST